MRRLAAIIALPLSLVVTPCLADQLDGTSTMAAFQKATEVERRSIVLDMAAKLKYEGVYKGTPDDLWACLAPFVRKPLPKKAMEKQTLGEVSAACMVLIDAPQ